MNRSEFIEQLAKKAGLTKRDATEATKAMLDLITDALADNKSVHLAGFGKFEVRTRKASVRINPQTRQRINIPAKAVPAFRSGKPLKEAVAKK